MFQIPEFEQSEPEDSSPADRGLGPSPTGDWPSDPVRHQRTAPGLLGEAGHQQGQPASSSHHGGRHPQTQPLACPPCPQARSSPHPGHLHTHWVTLSAGAVETRSRHSSYPEGTEDEGMEGEEPGPFRGRSRSAPPNLWAALRYGRELRRMSDEFQGSFQALPRPKSAGTATQMRQSPSWTRAIQSWWDRNLGRGGSAPSQ
uniref:BCL2 associated agonist of cell death n=1 Tax=Equus asinus TaxID=9793 RepID=A0A8C4MYJ3_EQUAS